jgi:hypothetical protein
MSSEIKRFFMLKTGIRYFTLTLFGICCASMLLSNGQAQKSGAPFSPQIPRVWDDEAVRSWSLPLAGLGEPPTYVSSDYYYRMPERIIYRTYPIYAPGKEPRGYLDWLKQQEPEVAAWRAGVSERRLRRVSHAAALHQQQADARRRLHHPRRA